MKEVNHITKEKQDAKVAKRKMEVLEATIELEQWEVTDSSESEDD